MHMRVFCFLGEIGNPVVHVAQKEKRQAAGEETAPRRTGCQDIRQQESRPGCPRSRRPAAGRGRDDRHGKRATGSEREPQQDAEEDAKLYFRE